MKLDLDFELPNIPKHLFLNTNVDTRPIPIECIPVPILRKIGELWTDELIRKSYEKDKV